MLWEVRQCVALARLQRRGRLRQGLLVQALLRPYGNPSRPPLLLSLARAYRSPSSRSGTTGSIPGSCSTRPCGSPLTGTGPNPNCGCPHRKLARRPCARPPPDHASVALQASSMTTSQSTQCTLPAAVLAKMAVVRCLPQLEPDPSPLEKQKIAPAPGPQPHVPPCGL